MLYAYCRAIWLRWCLKSTKLLWLAMWVSVSCCFVSCSLSIDKCVAKSSLCCWNESYQRWLWLGYFQLVLSNFLLSFLCSCLKYCLHTFVKFPNQRIIEISLLVGWSLTHIMWPSKLTLLWVIWQKIDKMFAAFTGQPLEKIQYYTDRDRFLSAAEVMKHQPLNWQFAREITICNWIFTWESTRVFTLETFGLPQLGSLILILEH